MGNKYIGHDSQLFGVEEHRLVGGKGDGMRLFQVKNGKGLEFTVSADRCADISRLSFKGDNYGFFSANGYVSPAYYDDKGTGFLKSFTAGFLTTCGLTAVGAPCEDEGQALPLHGKVSNTPAESIYSTMNDKEIRVHAVINHAGIFDEKLMMYREIVCSKMDNTMKITDTIKNIGSEKSPLMVLYHMNLGYPLLSETAQLYIPSDEVKPRNDHAKLGIHEWEKMLPPQAGFEEQCYYHSFKESGFAMIFNPTIGKGLAIQFDLNELDYFVQWKMLGEMDYVLGLEPGNCHVDGRDVIRREQKLQYIQPNEEQSFHLKIKIIENKEMWNSMMSLRHIQ